MTEITLQPIEVNLPALPKTPDDSIWGGAGDEPLGPLSPWDKVTVGDVQLPGIARVSGTGLEQRLEEKRTPGMNGVTVTDLGREVAKFQISLVLGASPSDWTDFKSVLPKLQPLRTVGGKQVLEAVSISHPAINVFGISAVKFKRIGVPHPGGAPGTFEVEFEAWEHRPPVAMPGSGTSHKSVKTLEQIEIPPEDALAPLTVEGNLNRRSSNDFSNP